MDWKFYVFLVGFLLFNGIGVYCVIKAVIKAARNSAKPQKDAAPLPERR